MKSGHPSLTKARVDVSGGARRSAAASSGRSEVGSGASLALLRSARSSIAHPHPEYFVIARAARELVGDFPAAQRLVVTRGALDYRDGLQRDTTPGAANCGPKFTPP